MNTIITLQLIMRQRPIIIVKLLIIMRVVGTIEVRNIRRQLRNTALKRMSTPALPIRIQANSKVATELSAITFKLWSIRNLAAESGLAGFVIFSE